MKNNITELLNQIDEIKKNKTSVYFYFFLLIGIGVIIIFGSHSLLKQTFEMELGYSSKISFEHTILVYLVGTLFLSTAFWNLNKYRQKLKKLNLEKVEIEKVLNEYELDFEIINKPKEK